MQSVMTITCPRRHTGEASSLEARLGIQRHAMLLQARHRTDHLQVTWSPPLASARSPPT